MTPAMRMAARITVALSGCAALILGTAGAASATHYTGDRGDGTLSCVSGEICFSQDSNGNGGLRHFYYGAEHDHAGNFHNGIGFWHNASAIRNRDTETPVCVEESGDFINDRWEFPRGASAYVNFATDLNDENARHWRGSC